jgi:hypothetical protein
MNADKQRTGLFLSAFICVYLRPILLSPDGNVGTAPITPTFRPNPP